MEHGKPHAVEPWWTCAYGVVSNSLKVVPLLTHEVQDNPYLVDSLMSYGHEVDGIRGVSVSWLTHRQQLEEGIHVWEVPLLSYILWEVNNLYLVAPLNHTQEEYNHVWVVSS